MNSDPPMHPAYFETHFRQEAPGSEWPAEFAVITAYATTGEQWTVEKNEAANRRLEAELRKTGRWLEPITGYSPATGHAEPGWAVDLPLEAACEVGWGPRARKTSRYLSTRSRKTSSYYAAEAMGDPSNQPPPQVPPSPPANPDETNPPIGGA